MVPQAKTNPMNKIPSLFIVASMIGNAEQPKTTIGPVASATRPDRESFDGSLPILSEPQLILPSVPPVGEALDRVSAPTHLVDRRGEACHQRRLAGWRWRPND